jgi:hypothetical protein
MSQTERELWIARIERALAELREDLSAGLSVSSSTSITAARVSRSGERSRG